MIDIALISILALAILASLIFTIPVTTLPLIITACGIVLTWRVASAQRKVAERKLFLDLMPRRAEWYDRIKVELEGRSEERIRQIETILDGKMPDNPEHLSKLWQLETEAGWLFGKEMVALTAHLISMDGQLCDFIAKSLQGDKQAAMETTKWAWEVSKAQSGIQDYLVEFLYVGDIGKPKRPPVSLAKVERRNILIFLKGRKPRSAEGDRQ